MQNKEFRNQFFKTKENLKKLDTLVESLVTGSKALEAKISLISQTFLGPSPNKHTTIVTTSSEK